MIDQRGHAWAQLTAGLIFGHILADAAMRMGPVDTPVSSRPPLERQRLYRINITSGQNTMRNVLTFFALRGTLVAKSGGDCFG
jgi:hypothetical protein